MSLTVAPASGKAATYAVTRWHYSGRMPTGKAVIFGVWEIGRFIGTVIFSRGTNRHIGSPYHLTQTEVCELTRIALRNHQAPVTQIIAESLRQLKRSNPGLRLVISYADPFHGHHGGIYQAGNWVYAGTSAAIPLLRVNGKTVHQRKLTSHRQTIGWIRANVDPSAQRVPVPPKHRYLYPLDRAMRRQVTPLARPYPAAEVSMVTRPAPGGERQVRPLRAAPSSTGAAS